MIKISYSRASTYLRCPYAHYLGYEERLMRNRPVRPLMFGSDFHKLLENRDDAEALGKAFSDIEEKYYEIPANWQSDLGENYLDDLRVIFGDYKSVYGETQKPDVTEKRFDIPIAKYKGEDVMFTGVIDEVYLDYAGEGKTAFGEHKTFSRKPDVNTLVLNAQKFLYAKAVELLYGKRPSRVIWDYINSTPAEAPVWLEKSGRFSNAKSQKITPFSYLRACSERGVTDPEVLAQAEQYRDNVPNFFFRYPMDLPEEMIDKVFADFKYTCRMIAKFGKQNKSKNLTRDCSWCGFRDICYTELTGGDTAYLLEKDFTVRPVEEVKQETEEVVE